MDTESAYLALVGESVDATRTLLPAPLRMAHVRMLRRTSERVRELSPVARGPVTRRAVRRAERTTKGHRVFSRWSGPVTGSWGCAARRTIVSEPPTNTKVLSKRHNDIDKNAFLDVLINRLS